ncbi:MAG TPA: methyltransferase domain-containing protein [Burkholderiales bacterium]|nr:methyltransferase domain-containing protein [Burkholderiales bacterium]
MSARSSAIDERAARRRFARAARAYAGASRLEAEVATRMLERLEYVKLAPRRILDAGSGPAREASALAARYQGAQIIALDYALAMLPRPRRWFKGPTVAVCGDIAHLPLAPQSVELVWCNMALHWVNEPLAAFREFARVLAPEGLLMFSTLGPDTLKELRAAAGAARVHAFIDMHDLGDMLLAAGMQAPVMDMELLRMEYRAGDELLADLRASGQSNARADRPRSLAGHAFLKAFRAAPVSATYEVVYGHAWRRADAAPAVKTVRVFKRFS